MKKSNMSTVFVDLRLLDVVVALQVRDALVELELRALLPAVLAPLVHLLPRLLDGPEVEALLALLAVAVLLRGDARGLERLLDGLVLALALVVVELLALEELVAARASHVEVTCARRESGCTGLKDFSRVF